MYSLNLGASKQSGTVMELLHFNIQDIFNTVPEKRMLSPLMMILRRRNYMQWQPRQFSISLSYRFKQGEKVDQPKKKKRTSTTITMVETNKADQCKKYEKKSL